MAGPLNWPLSFLDQSCLRPPPCLSGWMTHSLFSMATVQSYYFLVSYSVLRSILLHVRRLLLHLPLFFHTPPYIDAFSLSHISHHLSFQAVSLSVTHTHTCTWYWWRAWVCVLQRYFLLFHKLYVEEQGHLVKRDGVEMEVWTGGGGMVFPSFLACK